MTPVFLPFPSSPMFRHSFIVDVILKFNSFACFSCSFTLLTNWSNSCLHSCSTHTSTALAPVFHFFFHVHFQKSLPPSPHLCLQTPLFSCCSCCNTFSFAVTCHGFGMNLTSSSFFSNRTKLYISLFSASSWGFKLSGLHPCLLSTLLAAGRKPPSPVLAGLWMATLFDFLFWCCYLFASARVLVNTSSLACALSPHQQLPSLLARCCLGELSGLFPCIFLAASVPTRSLLPCYLAFFLSVLCEPSCKIPLFLGCCVSGSLVPSLLLWVLGSHTFQ